jgi:hypothetical protein
MYLICGAHAGADVLPGRNNFRLNKNISVSLCGNFREMSSGKYRILRV